VTGAPSSELVNTIIDSFSKKDIEQGLLAIKTAVEQNIDMSVFVSLILAKIRAILLMRYSPQFKKTIQESMSEKDFAFVEAHATSKESKISSHTLKTLLETYTMIGKSYAPHVPLEIALFELVQ
jgi:DNA polymerase III gamma/tau subunit